MSDFLSLAGKLDRVIRVCAASSAAFLLVAAASLAFAFQTAGAARDFANRLPVLVVPGAVGGTYTPGLTEENIRATARYLSALAANFGGKQSFLEHFDELERFASAQYLPQLQHARTLLQHEIETQNQSRLFYSTPSTEILKQLTPGHFEYTIAGDRTVFASGLPMNHHRSQVRLQLGWGIASPANRAGIALEAFSISDLDADSSQNPEREIHASAN